MICPVPGSEPAGVPVPVPVLSVLLCETVAGGLSAPLTVSDVSGVDGEVVSVSVGVGDVSSDSVGVPGSVGSVSVGFGDVGFVVGELGDLLGSSGEPGSSGLSSSPGSVLPVLLGPCEGAPDSVAVGASDVPGVVESVGPGVSWP